MKLEGRITVKVKPNANSDELISFKEGVLLVHLKAKPQDNKANLALIKFLRKKTKKQVRIVSGLTSRVKKVEFY